MNLAIMINRLAVAACLLAISSSIALAADVEDLIVLRDTLKPGSAEASREPYKTIVWTENERAFALKNFRRIHKLAPGLLPRATSNGTLSVYRVKLRNYAKGGTQRIALDKKVFLYPAYSYRVVLHELVHSADSYMKLSGSEEFRKIFVPRIKHARALLMQEGLTPATAAAMPLGEQRKKIEHRVREQTGLPSAYAARNLAECLSEVVSFWVFPEYKYNPPADIVKLLTPFVLQSGPPDLAGIRHRKAEAMYRKGDIDKSIKQWTEIIESEPGFYQALSARGYAYLNRNQTDRALHDLKQARDVISPYQSGHAFYNREWKRIRKLTQ